MFTLQSLNPYTARLYFVAVLIYSMVFMHPVLVGVNVVLSFFACIVIAKNETMAGMKYTVVFAAAIAFINPLFSTQGSTVLFTYFGRNYTLQALVYGFVMAGMLISSINWFSCMGYIITTDKFMYIAAGRMPRLTTVLSTVINLIPFFQKKLVEISGVQEKIMPEKNRTKAAARALNSAVSYAFEHAVNLSFSMKNRGYGTGKTTRYGRFYFTTYDRIFLVITALLSAGTLAVFTTATSVQIIPDILLPPMSLKDNIGFACYCILLAMPVLTKIAEELKWQYLKSKI